MDQWARATADRLDLIVWYLSTKYNVVESEVWWTIWVLAIPFLIIYLYYLIKLIFSPFIWLSDKKHEEREKVKKAAETEEKQRTMEEEKTEEFTTYAKKIKFPKTEKTTNKPPTTTLTSQITPAVSEDVRIWLRELQNTEMLNEQSIGNIKLFLKEEEIRDKSYFLKLYFSLSSTGRKELIGNDEFFRSISGKPHLQKLIQKIDNDKKEIPIEDFFEIRKKTMSENRKNKQSHLSWQYSGVYILYNETTDKYYVGQSINMFRRLRDHFTGYGNRHVYSTYQNGDKWFIKTVLLNETDFPSLNVLERSAIYYYNSCENGYNLSQGEFI